jgi:uncharacterized protein (TIGR03435 family)
VGLRGVWARGFSARGRLRGPGRRPGDPDGPADPGARPSIMFALEEQLGLKLESTKGRVEILVIDHVERPSEN